MPKISALALSFAFVLTPVLTTLCEVRCVLPTAAAAASPVGCHSAAGSEDASLRDAEAGCVHSAEEPLVLVAWSRDTRERQSHTPATAAALAAALGPRRAAAARAPSPPGASRRDTPSARHRILRV